MHDHYVSNVRVHLRDVEEQPSGRVYKGVVVYESEHIGHNGRPKSEPIEARLRAHFVPGKGFTRGDAIDDVVDELLFTRRVNAVHRDMLLEHARQYLNNEYRFDTEDDDIVRLHEEQPYSD